jgi:asparagine synthase (glutamine-hydrolysing)
MCGINGFVGKTSTSIEQMNDTIRHRGPDTSDSYTDATISLGHTLLSIRAETERSKQPFVSKDGPWVLIFNGQMYNTEQIKQELGFTYQQETLDTALLYALIEKHGWSFIEYIHGMYAIALYNKNEQVLRLYRDPSGQKPLYYYHKGNAFIFSSEIKGILSHKEVERVCDPVGVHIALSIGWSVGQRTIFDSISKVNCGECISLDIKRSTIARENIYSPALDYYKNTTSPFTKVVLEHLQSKEPVAINLSGGLDSSLILHEMYALGYDIASYTTLFETDDASYNTDAHLAEKLSRDYNTDHTQLHITKADLLNAFVESYEAIEEPNYNISIPIYYLMAKRQGIHGDKKRVILSGDGGDELFGGYPHYAVSRTIDRQMRFLTPVLFNAIKNARNHSSLHFNDPFERWLWFRLLDKKHSRDNINTIRNEIGHATKQLDALESAKSDATHMLMRLDRILWQGAENFVRNDKLYMTQSQEVRAPLSYQPFRDHFDAILGNERYPSMTNKPYLRRHYQNKLPEYIINRPDKTGWRAPVVAWYDAEMKRLFLEIIDQAPESTLVDWKRIQTQIEATDSWPGKHIHAYISLALVAKKFRLAL